jgi:TRAP-type C4-dicarboxylate transport system permease small subunit
MDPERWMDWLLRGINKLSWFGEILAEIGACVLAVVVIWGVVLTYVFKSSDVFSVEMSEYLLVFICFASIPYILREGRHVSVDAFVQLLSPKSRSRVELIGSIMALGFCALVVWKGAGVTLLNYQRGFRSASLVSLPLWIPYLIITLGFLLLTLQYIVQILELAGGRKS